MARRLYEQRRIGISVQSAALADLTAMWIAGHVAKDAHAIDELRERVLREHVALIRRLIPINAKLMDQNPISTIRRRANDAR
jgi:hypothetical protein